MLPKLKKLFPCEDYDVAKSIADGINADLKRINIVAARSFQEGLEETLAVTRMKVSTALRSSFTTTNIIESVNSTIAQRTRNVTNWSSPDQCLRWTAAIIVDAETKWRKVRGSHLSSYVTKTHSTNCERAHSRFFVEANAQASFH